MAEEKDKVSKEEVVKEKPKEENRYESCEIVTETGIATKDNETEKIFATDRELLMEILNKVNKVEKAII